MKKIIYQKPTLKVVTVQQQHIICTSPTGSATTTMKASWQDETISNGQFETE